jgi:hypothetical protein
MKKTTAKARKAKAPENGADDILPEYDFRGVRRNQYAERFAAGTRAVILDPDVASVFEDAASVNEALRALAKVMATHQRRRGKRTTA